MELGDAGDALGSDQWPPASVVYYLVDRAHECQCLGHRGDDPRVVIDFVARKRALPAILQPFLNRVEAADAEVPYISRNRLPELAPEPRARMIGTQVRPAAAALNPVTSRTRLVEPMVASLNNIRPGDREARQRHGGRGRIRVYPDQTVSEGRQIGEERGVTSHRNARKVVA